MVQKVPLAKYVSVMMTIWGGVTICTVAVHSYQGLLVQRYGDPFAPNTFLSKKTNDV
jgi:hypothetical protein